MDPNGWPLAADRESNMHLRLRETLSLPETNAILVMLVEGIHGHPPGFSTQKDIAMDAPTSEHGLRAQRA